MTKENKMNSEEMGDIINTTKISRQGAIASPISSLNLISIPWDSYFSS
jgi:hypothetical protein